MSLVCVTPGHREHQRETTCCVLGTWWLIARLIDNGVNTTREQVQPLYTMDASARYRPIAGWRRPEGNRTREVRDPSRCDTSLG